MKGHEFKREDKFFVLPQKDIEKYLDLEGIALLQDLTEMIENGRKADGKIGENRYVLVNEDEPYIELIWSMIELGEMGKTHRKDD